MSALYPLIIRSISSLYPLYILSISSLYPGTSSISALYPLYILSICSQTLYPLYIRSISSVYPLYLSLFKSADPCSACLVSLLCFSAALLHIIVLFVVIRDPGPRTPTPGLSGSSGPPIIYIEGEIPISWRWMMDDDGDEN